MPKLDPAKSVMAVVYHSPNREIQGKKRLQKIAHLLVAAGAPFDLEFDLLHYGAYSRQISDACDELFVFGMLDEEEKPVGVKGMWSTVYSWPKKSTELEPALDSKFRSILKKLSSFSTPELEVASTIIFFEKNGYTPKDARAETQIMKRAYWIQPVIAKAEQIIGIVNQNPT